MKKVWSEDNAFDLWLRVEVAACEAWSDLGVISEDEMRSIRQAAFNRAAYDKWFEETKHDVVSFTRAVSESLGQEAKKQRAIRKKKTAKKNARFWGDPPKFWGNRGG